MSPVILLMLTPPDYNESSTNNQVMVTLVTSQWSNWLTGCKTGLSYIYLFSIVVSVYCLGLITQITTFFLFNSHVFGYKSLTQMEVYGFHSNYLDSSLQQLRRQTNPWLPNIPHYVPILSSCHHSPLLSMNLSVKPLAYLFFLLLTSCSVLHTHTHVGYMYAK